MTHESPEISDAEKRAMRSGLAGRVGALMGAWWLGMFRARDDAEQELLDEIRAEIPSGEGLVDDGDSTPLGLQTQPEREQEDELVPLTDDEYLEVFDALAARYVRLRNAYRRGMVTAETPEQERQLAHLQEIME
jgi:hypothetical protein